MEVRHLNGVRTDSRLANLQYGTPAENAADMVRHGTACRLHGEFVSVVGVRFVGLQPTYDLEVDGPWHNFVASGVVVHNSFNEKSLRYCTAEREYYVPDASRIDPGQKHPHARNMTNLYGYHDAIGKAFDRYECLVADAWPREVARGALPLSIYTEFVWTVNAWSLMNWLNKRLDPAAQWEHRQYAEAALQLWKQAMPVTAEQAVVDGPVVYAGAASTAEFDAGARDRIVADTRKVVSDVSSGPVGLCVNLLGIGGALPMTGRQHSPTTP